MFEFPLKIGGLYLTKTERYIGGILVPPNVALLVLSFEKMSQYHSKSEFAYNIKFLYKNTIIEAGFYSINSYKNLKEISCQNI